MACSVLPLDTLAANVPSDWFVAEMNDANGKGLLTARAAKDFQRAMSRDEFCELAVLMTEYTLGKELPLPASNPFLDCNSEYVQKAYLYGMVNGIDTTHFGPDRPIERQQLVALMIRALTQTQTDLGKTLLAPPVPALPFNDSGKVSDYARTPLMYAYANNIVKGDDQNNFNPATNVTSQECVAVIIRSFNKTQDVINAALAQSSLIVKAADLLKIGYAYGDTAAGVSQNVLLPTAGLGGATVAWTSSNSSVISAAGVVNAAYSLPVMLTATVRLGSYTQTRTFNLQTTAYSGDKLIVENGYSELDVSFYNAGDSVDSVTGRIFLPSHSVSAAVTWASSNPSVVDTNGKVVLPANATIQTVALTATITSGAQSRTKTFNLKIRNPLYSVNAVALHGVTLGMTQAQVTALLGAAKGTMTTATSETWSVYYTDSYVGFIAVALQANKVVGVYSMAADWANQLRDSVTKQVVTAAQINEQSNVSATVYTDAGNANKQYAVFVADKTSTILRLRTQTAAGVEALTLAIMNAFRVQNSRAAFDADARLASSARSHSTDMGVYNYFTETGRTGSSTFITRAVAAGYDATAAASVTGAIIGGGVNAFDFLNDVVSNATNRARLIDTAKNVSGLGYYYATSASSYGSYCTVVFGVGTYLSNVTPVAALTVNGSAQGTTTLTLTPSSRSETVTVTSSGTGYLTLLSGNNGTAVSSLTIPAASPTFPLYFKGVAPTSAAYPVYINVKGDVSGKLFQIPVTVVAVNATSLAVKHNETVSSAAVGTPATASAPAIAADGSAVIILGVGNDFQLAATTAPAAGPVVTWSSAYPARATVNSAGKITGVAVGTTTITATVPRSGGVLTVSVYVYVVSMPLTTNSVPLTNNSPEIAAGTAVPVSASAVVGLPTGALTNPTGYTWTPTSTSGYA
ncbi:MAG: S-layer homology domain-containing protein, partial [Oscillospiraceae bacterium]|nr:S-layer homology domain-containing protein [Oscillospiraceae bacterium]